MDCRTFHRKLEDYLQGGLDFPGRFGMERHAQQCFSCGKELADTQQLKQRVSELQRVKAPANFESSLMREIATRKMHGRFWSLRKYWIYGFERPPWRRLAYAASAMAVLAFGIFYAFHRPDLGPVSRPALTAGQSAQSAPEVKEAKADSAPDVDALSSKQPLKAEVAKLVKKLQPKPASEEQAALTVPDAPDMDYVDYLLTGPDNNAVPVRLPKRIPMRYSQMSEEYFIQNVSH